MVDGYRVEKLSKLTGLGINPYPYSFSQKNHSVEITSNFQRFEGKEVSVAGRIIRMRTVGKLTFIDLLDQEGKIQVLAAEKLTIQDTDEKSVKLLEFIDSGDIVGVEGRVMKTKRGEISVEAKSIELLSKSLSGLPEKFHGLTDVELRYRKRHLDLISNPGVRSFFIIRAKILKYVRDFLDSKGYIEFETPILQQTYGGANAKPFKTPNTR
ncbi:MAG: OB-fold nucleic acid binding domain-containing protein, partial [Candidatus Marsarchaeota archaeon]|nr:OB-fold nucleic acid binding domain-containing protein [Candidatus Marsarchaeota archaeon]